MSERIKDGGPAFPHQFQDAMGHPEWRQSTGMTLRDYIAVHVDITQYQLPSVEAAAEFLGEAAPDPEDTQALFTLSFRLAAKLRYMAADAMIAAREGGRDG